MANRIIPVAKKVYVRDDVIGDPDSGKVTILNLWDVIRVSVSGFPQTQGRDERDKTFSDGVFIDVVLPSRPVPPGTKSTRWLAQQQKKAESPETPRPDQPPEQAPDAEAKE